MRGMVLDPTARPGARTETRAGGATSDLTGKVVGFRVDIMWRSWDWITDEWEAELTARGATVRSWRSGARFGDEGERMATELAQWVDEIDLAVVGLAN